MKKKNPKLSEKFKDFVRELGCVVCGDNVNPHHLLSRGAGGTDELKNLVPLCVYHHAELHQIGKSSFFKRHNLTTDFINRIIGRLYVLLERGDDNE